MLHLATTVSIKLVPLGPGLLHQHIKLCFDPLTVVCKHYMVPSSKETTLTLTPNRKYLPFSSSASLFSRPDSFAFSSQSCSMVWCSWPSSASCSTSTMIVSNNMTISTIQSTFADTPYLLSARICF